MRKLTLAPVLLVAALAGCGDSPTGNRSSEIDEPDARATVSAAAPVAATTAAPPATPAPDKAKVRIANQGFTQLNDSLSYGIALRNTADAAAVGVEVNTNALDAAGNVLGSETETINVIPGRENYFLGGEFEIDNDATVDRIEITADVSESDADTGAGLPTVSNARIEREEYGGYTLRAQVTNELDKPLSSLARTTFVIYDRAGRIIGGTFTFPENDIRAGRTVAVSTTFDFENQLQGAASVKASMDNEITG